MMKNLYIRLNKSIFKYNIKLCKIANESMPQKLKQKFYKQVDILEVTNPNINNYKNNNNDPQVNVDEIANPIIKNFINSKWEGGDNSRVYQILLDKKKLKSMHLDEFYAPSKVMAIALSEEWARQKEFVNLHTMHLVCKYIIIN
jgi:hypothetical protein